MADPSSANPLFELWRRQFEEGAQAWARLVTQTPTPPTDPTAFWKPVIDQGLQTWARIFAQTPVTPELSAQWKQFLDQWIEAWSRVLGQVMATEGFAQTQGKVLEQWLSMQALMKKAGEQALEAALQTFNLASRSQLTAVAKQIVELEERLERIEDGMGALLARLETVARELSARPPAPTPAAEPA